MSRAPFADSVITKKQHALNIANPVAQSGANYFPSAHKHDQELFNIIESFRDQTDEIDPTCGQASHDLFSRTSIFLFLLCLIILLAIIVSMGTILPTRTIIGGDEYIRMTDF